MENLYVDLTLVNQKVQFKSVSRTNPHRPVEMDYTPPIGDGQGFAGLELLLMSFCGCVSTAVVALLRREGKNIISYECSAAGIRQESPLMLKKIIFEVRVRSENTEASDMDKVLRVAESISPVWLAIKSSVEVETRYTIINE